MINNLTHWNAAVLDHRKEYADSNKRYRRMTRVKKQEFKRNRAFLATNLKNASVFLKELKNLGGEKRSSVSDKIDISEWHDRFKHILGHTFNETAISRMFKKTM